MASRTAQHSNKGTPDSVGTAEPRRQSPRGLATLAGALAEWDQLDEDVVTIFATRRDSEDRPVPDFG